MSEVYHLRLFGKRIIEFSSSFGLALSFDQFDSHAALHVHPLFGSIFIRLPQWMHREPPFGEIMMSYGFGWRWDKWNQGSDIHLNWGRRYKILHMPWSWEHRRTDILLADGTWHRQKPREWEKPEGAFAETHPYSYCLKSGRVQERIATIGVEEREWRWRGFQWLPFPRRIDRTIDVRFDDEVGERTGSWKGGVLGCGYSMRDGESPVDTLRRMERERKFT